MTIAGTSYRDRQRGRVKCMECGEEIELELLAGHRKTQYGKEEGGIRC